MIKIKLIIFDADDTLWKGNIYNNYDGVKLKDSTKETLRQLDKKDIILAVCSRNELEPLVNKLKELGLYGYFKGNVCASLDIGKDEMVKAIIKQNDVDVLETLFIDDQPINRDLVHTNVGCHVDFMQDLYQIFKYIDTDRLKIMCQQRGREDAEKRYKGSLKDFIRNSGLEVDIRAAREKEIYRIKALTLRTNHLNATQQRFDREKIKEMMDSDYHEVMVTHAKDKYGDYGLIGECITEYRLDKKELTILDLCISCRVMKRGIGNQIMKELQDSLAEGWKLIGKIRKTDKNVGMQKLFKKTGMKEYREKGDIIYYKWQNK